MDFASTGHKHARSFGGILSNLTIAFEGFNRHRESHHVLKCPIDMTPWQCSRAHAIDGVSPVVSC